MMNYKLTEQNKTEIVQLLSRLVRIPSVNNGENQQGIPEQQIAEFISEFLQKLGMEVEWFRMKNGRPNVLGRWPENRGKKIQVLTAHMDTVNIDGMTVDPFEAKIDSGKMYGRGTCDTKGSLAVYLWVVQHLSDTLRNKDRDVQFLATCDEENGCIGSTWLAEHKLIQADEVIVGEPTNARIAIAHRGSIVLEISTQGISAHSSVPERGDNAIYQMSEIIHCLQTQWLPKLAEPSYPILGKACASVTMVQGGIRFNVIPESCKITVDVRTLPTHTPETIVQEIDRILSPLRDPKKVNYRVSCPYNQPAVYTDPECAFVRQLLASQKEVSGDGNPIGVAYFADSSQFARLGAKCVLLGPGDIRQAHNATEYVEIDQLFTTAMILNHFFAQD